MAKRKADETEAGPEPIPGFYPVVIKGIKGGGPGDFDARVTTPDGVVVEAPTSRREAEMRVDAYTGQPGDDNAAALRYWNSILAVFPPRNADFKALVKFAQDAEIVLPGSIQAAPSAWVALFGEANDLENAPGGFEQVTTSEDRATAAPKSEPAEEATEPAAADGEKIEDPS